MTDVLFIAHHNTSAWWQYIADNLNFTKSAFLLTDVRTKSDFCIVDDFYTNLRSENCEQIAINQFSAITCEDIIRRCRVLRNLDKSKALSMIGSMWLVFDRLIQKEKPKIVISFIIDRYLMDVLNRILELNNIPFLGMTASIVPDYVMFMDRGKLIPLREPEAAEIELSKSQLLNESFAPSYVSNSKKFSRLLFWRTFLYFKLRGLAFQFIRYLKRDTLNLHYLDALNSLSHKPRLLDYQVLNYLNKDWADVLEQTPRNKRALIPLQLLPEASLDYWLDDLSLLNNDETILHLCRVLGNAGYVVFIKDHPLQFGFRKRDIIKKLSKLSFVVLVPYEIPATYLIKECPITVTFTGTVGFQSVLAGSCSVVSDAYYSNAENFIHFRNYNDIAMLPEKIESFQKNNPEKISERGIKDLLSKVLSASVPGDIFSFKGFNKENPDHVLRVRSLVDSFNKYLPKLINKNEKCDSVI